MMVFRKTAALVGIAVALSTLTACGSQASGTSAPTNTSTGVSTFTPSATAPPTTPNQTTSQPAGPLNEFGITDAEYKAIVKSYAIDANQYTTPEQVTAAFMERINKYYADGNSIDAQSKHMSYKAPDGIHMGWNAWATGLYTKALVEGLYLSSAQEKGGLGEQYAANDKIVKALWSNSADAGEVPYKLTNSFAITDVVEKTASTFTVRGTQTVADNSAQVPSAAHDSRKIGTQTFPNSRISFMLDSINNRWFVAGEAGR